MLAKSIFKELDEYLKKYGIFLLADEQKEKRVPTLGGRYLDSEEKSNCEIELEAFLKNKKIFSRIIDDTLKEFKIKNDKEYKNSDIYKKAYMSKQVFSNLFNTGIPKKDTVIKLAFALECSTEEAEKLLKFAGYAFGDCIKRDLIFKFCFEKGITNVLDVNEILGKYGEDSLLKNYKNEKRQDREKFDDEFPKSRKKEIIDSMAKIYKKNRKTNLQQGKNHKRNLVILE